jgi:hypothetical protein
MVLVAGLVAELLALFFWLRGLYRNSKADVVAGWILFVVTMGLWLEAVWGNISSLSVPVLIFGAVNLAASFVDRLKSPIISPVRLRFLGVACLILAFVLSLVL